METEFEWRDEYNIGVDIIDREHQRLFKIINKLYTFREEEKDSQWTCQEGIKYFKGHAAKHFADEEAYMESIGYEGLEQHRHIHDDFRKNTLPALEQELERTGYAPDAVEHFLGVCAGWLIGHTMTEDLAIAGKHDQRWKNRFTAQEQRDIKKVITQLIFDMFQLEAHLVSDTYAGEKFGRGVYYRLIWGGEKAGDLSGDGGAAFNQHSGQDSGVEHQQAGLHAAPCHPLLRPAVCDPGNGVFSGFDRLPH